MPSEPATSSRGQAIPGRVSATGARVLLSRRFGVWVVVVAGVLPVFAIASWAAWGTLAVWTLPYAWPLLIAAAAGYLAATAFAARIAVFPNIHGSRILFLAITAMFALILIAVTLSREYYSRQFLLISYIGLVLWGPSMFTWVSRRRRPRFALVPGGITESLTRIRRVQWVTLENPDLDQPVDGVVADLHRELPADWVQLLSHASVNGVPVYHAAHVYEGFNGRVSLEHISEGLLDMLFQIQLYRYVKRWADIGIVLLTLPLTLPVALLLAIGIRLESPGGVLFRQTRVGQGGRPFEMVKFRSMRHDSEQDGAQFASSGDMRITRIGRVIRKVRLDELPQFWNILKGEMSLIGPRPEQVGFSAEFEKSIPYYYCRHLVKPGLTGWAQVNAGYAAGEEETRIKLEYDLYYIKHLSLWIDLVVVFKTFRTIVTGHGAI